MNSNSSQQNSNAAFNSSQSLHYTQGLNSTQGFSLTFNPGFGLGSLTQTSFSSANPNHDTNSDFTRNLPSKPTTGPQSSKITNMLTPQTLNSTLHLFGNVKKIHHNPQQPETRGKRRKPSQPDHPNPAEKYFAWTEEQENELTTAIEEFGTANWELIASRIQGHRTAPQCIRHWENKLSPALKRGPWSLSEDESLRKLVGLAQVQGLGFLDISGEDIKANIPGRTLKQARERWRSNLDPSIVRGKWTREEDDTIIQMKEVQGLGWANIARALKTRTEHSVKIRHRFIGRAQQRAWTKKEDQLILELVKKEVDWTTVANELKTRTVALVQTRWKELTNSGT